MAHLAANHVALTGLSVTTLNEPSWAEKHPIGPSPEWDQSAPALPPSGLRWRLVTTANPWRPPTPPSINICCDCETHVCAGERSLLKVSQDFCSFSTISLQFLSCVHVCTFRFLLYFTVSSCSLSAAVGAVLSYCWWKPNICWFLLLHSKNFWIIK